MNSPEIIRTLGDGLLPIDAEAFGLKAHNLDILCRLGFAVPDAICVAAALFDADDWANTLAVALGEHFSGGKSRVHLAVRSSASNEDSAHQSQAGQYLTEINWFATPAEVAASAWRVHQSAADPGVQMSVIIQEAVSAQYSGVAFSCDPVTFERSRHVLSFVEGMGSDLVSGRASGRTLVLERASGHWREAAASPGPLPLSEDHLSAVCEGLSRLEAEYGVPVDVEWAIGPDETIAWLQVRPVVLPAPADIPLTSLEAIAALPAVVRDHHKLRLRKWALEMNIPMSPAVAHVRSSSPAPTAASTSLASDSAGTSVVLLYPTLVGGQVQREFSGTSGAYADMIIESCHRYTIRRYPKFTNLTSAISDVTARGLKDSWLSLAIDAKILDAHLTGTVARIDDGYIVEMAQGHFVPKGVVTTQQFVLSSSYEVLSRRGAKQKFAFRFLDGRVVLEDPIADPIPIAEAHATEVCRVLGEALDKGHYKAFEFGILDSADPQSLYLIDTIDSDVPTVLSSVAIEAGIISQGLAVGRSLPISASESSAEAFDHHFHSQLDRDGQITDTVLFAEQDSIALLPLVGRLGANCAVLFRSASVLSHLSIVLREKNIPAAVVASWPPAEAGSTVTVDTRRIEQVYAAARALP